MGAPPDIHPVACTDDPTRVCLTQEDAIALAKWIVRVKAENQSLAGCPYVTWFDPARK